MKTLTLLLGALSLAALSCGTTPQEKTTEIFLIDVNDTTIWMGSYYLHESFVISNPPDDEEELLRLVTEFDRQTVDLDELGRNRRRPYRASDHRPEDREFFENAVYAVIRRKFYRESKLLTRDFKEGGRFRSFWAELVFWGYHRDRLQYHEKDALLITEYEIHDGGQYTFGHLFFSQKEDNSVAGWKIVLDENELSRFINYSGSPPATPPGGYHPVWRKIEERRKKLQESGAGETIPGVGLIWSGG